MNFKKWPYWVRGGLIGVLFSSIFCIIPKVIVYDTSGSLFVLDFGSPWGFGLLVAIFISAKFLLLGFIIGAILYPFYRRDCETNAGLKSAVKKGMYYGALLGLLLSTIGLFLSFNFLEQEKDPSAFLYPGFFITIRQSNIGTTTQFLTSAFILNTVFFIVLGLVIGWLYGKIKNRRTIHSNTQDS